MSEFGQAQFQEFCSCGQTKEWHQENSPRHEFTPAGPLIERADPDNSGTHRDAAKELFDQCMMRVRRQSDPVLRLILMRHGVITQDEIDLMEYRLAHSMFDGKHVLEVPRGAAADQAQDPHTAGHPDPPHPGDRDGGESVRGMWSHRANDLGGSDQLGQKDGQQGGQPLQ